MRGVTERLELLSHAQNAVRWLDLFKRSVEAIRRHCLFVHACDFNDCRAIIVLLVSSIDLQFHSFKTKVQTTYIPVPYTMLHCGKIIIHFEQDFSKIDD